jgi:hypothetical protein
MSRFDPVETYLPGHTVIFTWTASIAPDAPPLFSVFDPSSTVVASVTATQSDATNYYVLFTMPGSGHSHYVAEFHAVKSFSGSAYAVISRDAFRVRDTGPKG